MGAGALVEHQLKCNNCTRCDLHKASRSYVTYAGYEPPIDVLFVGEGPGLSEDVLGEPFVGKSGKLLRNTIADLNLDLRYGLTNVVACRPHEVGVNRQPTPYEIIRCAGRLQGLVYITMPKYLVAVGKVADEWLSHITLTDNIIGSIPHPAYILRSLRSKDTSYASYMDTIREVLNNGLQY